MIFSKKSLWLIEALLYSALVNSTVPEFGDLLFTQILITLAYGLVHKLNLNSLMPIQNLTICDINNNNNNNKNNNNNNLFSTPKELLSQPKSPIRRSPLKTFPVVETQLKVIDRMKEENEQLLACLLNMEHERKNSPRRKSFFDNDTDTLNDSDSDDHQFNNNSPHNRKFQLNRKSLRKDNEIKFNPVTTRNLRIKILPKKQEESFTADFDHLDEALYAEAMAKRNIDPESPITSGSPSPRPNSGYTSSASNPYSRHGDNNSDTDLTDYSSDLDDCNSPVWDEKEESKKVVHYKNKLFDMLEERDPSETFNLEQVNSGGTSKVYKATHTKIPGKIIAIKAMSIPELKLLNLTYSEVIASRVLRHPNIVQNLTQSRVDDKLCLMMEYCERGNLCDFRNKKPGKKFSENEIAFIIGEILQGLNYIHSLGYIHRDIKSQNILVTEDCKIKIADLGSMSLQSRAALKVGTLYWMAPEVLFEEVYDNRIDVWSLGITAIELIDGKPPWYPLGQRRVVEMIRTVGTPPLPADISSEFESFLRDCLTVNPQDRPSASDLLRHPFLEQVKSIIMK